MTARSTQKWAAWTALAALQVFWVVTREIVIYDETWFLQVVRRMLDGETLYRDIYFNTTPLSVYVTAAVAALTGVQLIAVKLVAAFSVLASLAVAVKTIERSFASQRVLPLVVTALVMVYGNYPSHAPYNPLAVTFYMLALHGFVAWLDGQRDRALFWSGIAAGLSFATKYNTGLLAMAALALAIVVWSRTKERPVSWIVRRVSLAGGGFVLVVVATVAIIAATGGLEGFVEYAFLNKTSYLAVGTKSYLTGLQTLVALPQLYLLLILVIPPMAVVLVVRWWRLAKRAEKTRAATLGIFLLAGYAITYPRAAAATWYVMPILTTISAIAWHRGAAPRNRRLRVATVAVVIAWLACGALVMVVRPVRRLLSPESRLSRMPYCRGILVRRTTEEEWLRTAAALRHAAGGEATFIQSMTAGFYYLASGIRNPSPYDMPAVSTFGPEGQRKVIALIEAGRIERVAVFPESRAEQVPRELLHYVTTRMVPIARTAELTVYARRAE